MMYKKESCASGWSMAHAARAVFHTRIALLCAGMAFICTACDFFTPTWNEPVGEWLRKYTSEAAIDRHEFSSSYIGTDGFPCVSTERDCIVTFYMRNPQNYDLKPQYSFSGGIGGTPSSPTPMIEQDVSDRSILRMTLPQQFLHDNDIGKEGAKPVEVNVRIGQDWDEANTSYLREFGSYSFSFECNSAPPALEGAVVYKEVDGSGSYVVFFNAPDKALMKERHRDVTHIIINGSRHEVEVEEDGETKFEGSPFTKVSVSDINDTTKYTPAQALNTFTHISGRDIWCYNTGNTSGSDVTFTLSLVDRLGIANTVHASTSRLKLGVPTIDGTDACGNKFTTLATNILAYAAQTESNAPLQSAVITVKAPTKAYGNTEASLDDVNGITIHWSLNDPNKTNDEGQDSANVTTPPGTWTLTAYAEHPSYDRSDDVSYTVVLPSDIYVADNGTGRGTARNDAVGSLSETITIIKKINPHAVPVDFTIYVSGKIENTAVEIKPDDGVHAKTLTIKGANKTNDILSGNGTHTVLSVSQHNRGYFGTNDKRIEEVIVDNITITNGTRGVHIKGTNFTMKGNTAITGNTSTASDFVGSGVYFEDGQENVGNITFTMEGGVINKNTSKNNNACYGVDVAVGTTNSNAYKKLTFIMKNGTIGFSSTFVNDEGNNKNTKGQGSVAIGGTCSMHMSGNAVIKEAVGVDGVYLHKATLTMCENAVIGGSSNTEVLRYGVLATQASTVYLGYDSTLNKKNLNGGIKANAMGGIHVSGYRSQGNLQEYLSYVHMDSGSISENTGPGITLDSYVTFAMAGGIIKDNNANSSQNCKGGGVAMKGVSTTFTMTGGTISGNTAEHDEQEPGSGCGGGIMVQKGTFTMTDGTIADNVANVNGGGVFLGEGTFTMKGGVIGKRVTSAATKNSYSNYATGNGGGVKVGHEGTFTQEAGLISYNYADKDSDNNGGEGGGVNAWGMVILKGTVQYNGSSGDGGGVYYVVGRDGKSFTMDGTAAIINNVAQGKGGGLFFQNLGTTDPPFFKGGKIKGNSSNNENSKQYYITIGDPPNPTIYESSDDVEDVLSIAFN